MSHLMYKSEFGKRKKMKFNSPSEFYETLGFLAKSEGNCSIYREDNHNQGAWAHEVRANCLKNLSIFPLPLKDKFTKGRGKGVLHRINCNEFFEGLLTFHKFQFGLTQDYQTIKNTIPNAFLNDFDRGYNL